MDTTPQMKIYGYPEDQDLERPLTMREVTFVTTPEKLRKIATFLNYAADLIDKHGEDFGHEHFSFFAGTESEESPDVIVSRLR